MTRSMMVARSNSAKTPSICTIIRPEGVAVSKGSVAERNDTPPWSSCSSNPARPLTERDNGYRPEYDLERAMTDYIDWLRSRNDR